jgi:hypothetical protein
MNLLSKIGPREKKFLIIGGIVILSIIIFEGYTWYDEFKKRADDFSDARLVMLDKQLSRISGKDKIEKHLGDLKLELERQEKAILQGDKPPVAAAALSNILSEAASSQGVNIAMERTLNPSDVHSYVAVPVEIGFTTTTEKLKEILYRLRTSPFLLTVSEIKVRVLNVNKPTDIYTSLIVTGYIKKPLEPVQENMGPDKADEKKVKKEAKDVT